MRRAEPEHVAEVIRSTSRAAGAVSAAAAAGIAADWLFLGSVLGGPLGTASKWFGVKLSQRCDHLMPQRVAASSTAPLLSLSMSYVQFQSRFQSSIEQLDQQVHGRHGPITLSLSPYSQFFEILRCKLEFVSVLVPTLQWNVSRQETPCQKAKLTTPLRSLCGR